jgi:hypothetical protein
MRSTLVTAALAGCVLAAVSGLGTGANAATVSCPGTAATTDREFSVTTAGLTTATCIASDEGNINGNGDAVNGLGYVTIDKSDNTTAYVGVDAELTITGTGALSGNFSFTAPAGYFNFVLGLKSGEGQLNPDWVAFLLPAGILSGTWAILTGNQSLSHANLYAQACPRGVCGNDQDPPNPVPLPGAVWLMGTVLAGSAGIRRWRNRKARNVVA